MIAILHFQLVKKEPLLDHLARVQCRSGDLFLALRKQIKMNNFDYGFGLENGAFLHQDKCFVLNYRYANCY